MTEPATPPPSSEAEAVPSVAARLALYQRAGGIATPLMTAFVAFFVGGLVVLVTTHKNPLATYREIFNGTGLNWLFPWIHGQERFSASLNLQQTLILTTTLILTGLAVAFAFRCGLFNIGGQGQYFVGVITGIWVGTSFPGMNHPLHVVFAIVVASLAGAAWAAIAGFLKATTGAHEVITTIMLNWIAYWIASWAFSQGGPLQGPQRFSPVSGQVASSAKLPVFWGSAVLQGVHIGFFVALAALVAFWFILQRTTLGYQIRAVGFNPEAARYGGISVARNYVVAMAISGLFAALAGAMDILGYLYKFGQLDVPVASYGFIGIAVALLGRNKAVGIFFGALLFACLIYGTSGRGISNATLPPELAGNLAYMIQALVLLFIGADVLILYVWQARRKLVPRRPAPPAPRPSEAA